MGGSYPPYIKRVRQCKRNGEVFTVTDTLNLGLDAKEDPCDRFSQFQQYKEWLVLLARILNCLQERPAEEANLAPICYSRLRSHLTNHQCRAALLTFEHIAMLMCFGASDEGMKVLNDNAIPRPKLMDETDFITLQSHDSYLWK